MSTICKAGRNNCGSKCGGHHDLLAFGPIEMNVGAMTILLSSQACPLAVSMLESDWWSIQVLRPSWVFQPYPDDYRPALLENTLARMMSSLPTALLQRAVLEEGTVISPTMAKECTNALQISWWRGRGEGMSFELMARAQSCQRDHQPSTLSSAGRIADLEKIAVQSQSLTCMQSL